MENKHTKGPWVAGKVSGESVNISTGDRGKERFLSYSVSTRDKADFFVDIAKVHGKENVSKANARLIAAAPELLEALKFLCNYLGEDWKDMEPVVDAQLIIAKAEGK